MKIAFLNKTYGKIYRGGETFVGELGTALSKLGHDVKIVKSVWKIKDADVVVSVDGRGQTILAKVWCLVHGKKLVISGQSGLGADDKLNLLAFPDVFLGLTAYQTSWAKKFNRFVNLTTIPNGVNLSKFKPVGTRIKIDLPKPVILVVSALTKEKRIDLAIKAVSKLEYGSLLIVGKGDEEENLQKLGKELLPDRFKIIALPYEKMPEAYRAVDLMIFSTVPWESFGIVMLEAMATNLPVVVSDDPIRKEIIGDAGFTVNVENTIEFAQKIKEALKINWGDKPIEQAKKFSWDKIAEKYDQLFRNLTGL